MEDRFQPDAALIPLMTETEQLRLGVHPTHEMLGGYPVRRTDIRWGTKAIDINWPSAKNEENET